MSPDPEDLASGAAQIAASAVPLIGAPGDIAAGELIPESVEAADWLRMAQVVAAYRDLLLGTVDASGVVAAERLGGQVIATLDRRHFALVRPRHIDAFDLVP